MASKARKRVNASMRLRGRFFSTELRDTPDANLTNRMTRYFTSAQYGRDLRRVHLFDWRKPREEWS